MAEVQESKPQQEFNSPELTPVKFSARSKVVVKAAEMDKDMIQHAITLADNAVLSNLNAGKYDRFIIRRGTACSTHFVVCGRRTGRIKGQRTLFTTTIALF
jgi:hypothetical protein